MIIPGTQGTEQVYFQPLTNEILDPGQVEELRDYLKDWPRKLTRFNNFLEPVTKVWTWQEQRSRFSPFDIVMVKADVRYLRADGSAI